MRDDNAAAPSVYTTTPMWQPVIASTEPPSEAQVVADNLKHLSGELHAEMLSRVMHARMLGLRITPELYATLLDAVATTSPLRGWVGKAPAAIPIAQTALVDPQSVVYYLKFGDRVKIGTSRSLAARLKAIPHDELLALEVGSYDVESIRHAQFAELRLTGEWFRYEDALVAHVRALQAA